MEWLIRRYDVHHRPTTANALLRCLAPHHGNAMLFGRTLLLVDLAELPTWTFLRPRATTDGTKPCVPRSVFSRCAAKDDVLVVVVCDIAKSTAVSHVKGGGGAAVRCGLSHMISFLASVLSEALTLQRDASGLLRESTMSRFEIPLSAPRGRPSLATTSPCPWAPRSSSCHPGRTAPTTTTPRTPATSIGDDVGLCSPRSDRQTRRVMTTASFARFGGRRRPRKTTARRVASLPPRR